MIQLGGGCRRFDGWRILGASEGRERCTQLFVRRCLRNRWLRARNRFCALSQLVALLLSRALTCGYGRRGGTLTWHALPGSGWLGMIDSRGVGWLKRALGGGVGVGVLQIALTVSTCVLTYCESEELWLAARVGRHVKAFCRERRDLVRDIVGR